MKINLSKYKNIKKMLKASESWQAASPEHIEAVKSGATEKAAENDIDEGEELIWSDIIKSSNIHDQHKKRMQPLTPEQDKEMTAKFIELFAQKFGDKIKTVYGELNNHELAELYQAFPPYYAKDDKEMLMFIHKKIRHLNDKNQHTKGEVDKVKIDSLFSESPVEGDDGYWDLNS